MEQGIAVIYIHERTLFYWDWDKHSNRGCWKARWKFCSCISKNTQCVFLSAWPNVCCYTSVSVNKIQTKKKSLFFTSWNEGWKLFFLYIHIILWSLLFMMPSHIYSLLHRNVYQLVPSKRLLRLGQCLVLLLQLLCENSCIIYPQRAAASLSGCWFFIKQADHVPCRWKTS